MEQWLDWSAFGFLALLTLLDGLRQVPAGALVLRKVVGGKWSVVDLREGYALVSWWPPLSTTIVLGSLTAQPEGPLENGSAQSPGNIRGVLPLQILGFLSLVSLVVVVPLAMRWLGGMGFLLALLVVIVLSCTVAGLSFRFTRSDGSTTRRRLLFALPRLNPFATPAAGEALLERAMARANPFAVARALMTEDDFLAWIRPAAYDLTTGENEGPALLTQVIKRNELKKMLAERPARVAAESPWCPRCGAEYGSTSTECAACEVPLKA